MKIATMISCCVNARMSFLLQNNNSVLLLNLQHLSLPLFLCLPLLFLSKKAGATMKFFLITSLGCLCVSNHHQQVIFFEAEGGISVLHKSMQKCRKNQA